jgi:hypothetical protein
MNKTKPKTLTASSHRKQSFTIRRLKTIQGKLTAVQAHVDALIAALGKTEPPVGKVEQRPEHVNGANGKAAA